MSNTDYILRPIRSAAILTNAYVAGTTLGAETTTTLSQPNEYNQLVLLISLTKGSLTSAEVKVEFSPDNTTYYQETAEKVDTATGIATDAVIEHQFTATGNYRLAIPCTDRYIKVSAKGTGTVTSSSMTINAVLGMNF
jgi:hypothetical protein